MVKKITMVMLALLLLAGCTNKKVEAKSSIYQNAYHDLYASINFKDAQVHPVLAEFSVDTSNLKSLNDFSTLVIEGEFLGITGSYVNAFSIVHTIYDFKVSRAFKGASVKAGDVVQVAIPGGVMAYEDYVNQLQQLGVANTSETPKSEALVKEKYNEQDAEKIIKLMNQTKTKDVVIQNYEMNPLTEASNTFVLFLTEGEKDLVYETVALNHGYKRVTAQETVQSVGASNETTSEFKLTELTQLNK